ncbi:MAG: signal peptidase I, partial [Pseudobdellovibrionaceae bacterium]
ALLVRYFVLAAYRVPTSSMAPTLRPGDFIFSSQVSYGIKIPGAQKRANPRLPERGEVIIFTHPGKSAPIYVKRVLALPGDRIEIQKGLVVLNDKPLTYESVESSDLKDLPGFKFQKVMKESFENGDSHLVMYASEGSSDSMAPRVIPPDEIFVLGDNRDASDDSRDWGTVPTAAIEGRATCIWLSLDWQDLWLDNRLPKIRWNRVFTCLD